MLNVSVRAIWSGLRIEGSNLKQVNSYLQNFYVHYSGFPFSVYLLKLPLDLCNKQEVDTTSYY